MRITLALCIAVLACPSAMAAEFDLYLVRHAEKASDGTRDPALTPDGEARAARLAAWLSTRGIEAAWSTNYQRTRQTVAPLAKAQGLKVKLYEPGDLTAQATALLEAAQTAVVAGHSNTTPELAAALCNCPVEPIDESVYNRLYHLRVEGDVVSLTVLDQSQVFDTPE